MASAPSAEENQDIEPAEPALDQNNTSSQSLLSRGGSGYESQFGSLFGSRFSLTDGSGIFISSLTLTIIISAIAVIGIVLIAVIITLAVMLSSCEQRSAVTVSLGDSADLCSSVRLNMELNNVQWWGPPEKCKKEIFKYLNGGQYMKDVAMAVNSARTYLRSLPVEDSQSVGVVLDIDETALSNTFLLEDIGYRFEGLLDEGLGYQMNSVKTLPMLPVLELYNELLAANWSIFFVSERPESALGQTMQTLLDFGYKGWRGIFLRSLADSENVQGFKSNKRIEIEKQGYRIVCTIGDQWSDITGPATGNRTFKLPNPIYQIL